MTNRLEGKVALVTGGGSGIGRATAFAFAREGAKVVVCDVNVESAQATVQEIESAGRQSILVEANVTKRADVEAMVSKTIEAYGQLDCAFNNAGIEGSVGVSIDKADEDDWDRVIDINLKGVWLCLKYEIAQMLKQGSGTIVNTASIAGLVGGTFGAAYYASKHGVVGLSKAAAVECGKSGIRVNAVCPGVIQTEMAARLMDNNERVEKAITALHPLGRLGTADEVAETVVWLCSDSSSFVTGQAVAVDGGYVAQ
ncbi:MAG: NAD(P)-dependent dehydrogenase (short-subunit alcohol dehydrogenase family) [Halioglobus sp.]|jgi:NAD(P)-dependent dehydrogenase (short-subunit alcohol dehydrogenase family)